MSEQTRRARLGSLRAAAERTAARTPEERDRYADLVRVVAILVVVLGHWTAAVVLDDDGQLVAGQLLTVEPWTRWATWIGQVMPLFFLVGGRVNIDSLRRARAQALTPTTWVRKRARRLLRPFLPLLVVWIPLGPALASAGVEDWFVELATRTALLPLWFLVVYLLVIALAPVSWWLHERFGWRIPVAAALVVAIVDTLDRAEVPVVGQANYVLVFAIAHQLGYFWAEGRLPAGSSGLHLAWIGYVITALLVGFAGYPLSMVGLQAGTDSNATPPTLALVTLTLAQLGLVLALRGPASRWLRRALPWAGVTAVGTAIVTIFLWHMTALVIVASATHFTGWWPELTTVDARWWAWRPAWLLLCALALVPLVLAFRGFEGAGDPGPGGPATTLAGLAATTVALNVILDDGLYDAERVLGVPLVPLGLLVFGLVLLGVHRATRDAG